MEKEFEKNGWDIIVITEKDDLTSHKGIQKAINAINGPEDVLWHSQPCVGGCPWTTVNLTRSEETRN